MSAADKAAAELLARRRRAADAIRRRIAQRLDGMRDRMLEHSGHGDGSEGDGCLKNKRIQV